jgi:hypothetical protein
MSNLLLNDESVADENLMVWLEQQGASGALSLQHEGKKIPVNYIAEAAISEQFKFVRTPRVSI